jgi:polysaccharide chain length determinant protein (PEP-CTERM system associated)
MMNFQTLTPSDLLAIAVRRKWLILLFSGISVGIAWTLCLTLPKSYRSSTLIVVEHPKIPESYVNPVVRGSVADRLSMLQQQVLSRSVLSRVIDEFQLYGDRVKREGYEAVIETMRKSIKIETKGGAQIDTFSISFAHESPDTARVVTEKLASQFIDENLKVHEQFIEGTTEFLDQELERAKASLEEQERAIAQFKKRYMGELPGQMEANLHTLGRLQKDLASVNEQLQSRADRRAAIQKMINAYETLGLTFLEVPGNATSPEQVKSGVVIRGSTRKADASDPLAARLRELERSLASLSAEYKDTYPDIIQLKQEIAAVKVKLTEKNEKEKEIVEQQPVQTSTKPSKSSSSTVLDPYLHELRREREENEIGIAALVEQQRKLTAQTREYELRVEKAPEREQELLVLQRDYENTKKNYQALLEKQLNARISENLEKRQKGENFRVLDRANLPRKPESPDQFRIMLIGFVLGGAIGCGAAIGLELLSGVFRRPEELERLLGLPVLAAIPHFRMAYEPRNSVLLEDHAHPHPGTSRSNGKSSRQLLSKPEFRQKPTKYTLLNWKRYTAQREAPGGERTSADTFKQELTLVTKWRPKSFVAEQFRVAATRLVLSSLDRKSTVVVVTSAVQGEGKSATASNLAFVLAQDLGKSALLIDCDFKRPMLHLYTGVPAKPGLADVLNGDAPVESCFHRSGDSSLWVLPSGWGDHQSVDLRKIPQLGKLVAELKDRFDFVIIDTPPILPLADVNLLRTLADMILLVVRAGVTNQEIVQSAVTSLKPAGDTRIILTGYDEPTTGPYMESYYYGAKGSYLP